MSVVLAFALLVTFALSSANLLLWLYRDREAWRVTKSYPTATRLWATVPFSRRWEGRVAEADAAAFSRFRRGFIINYYLLWVTPVLSLLFIMTCLSWLDYRASRRDLEEMERQIKQLREQADHRSSLRSDVDRRLTTHWSRPAAIGGVPAPKAAGRPVGGGFAGGRRRVAW